VNGRLASLALELSLTLTPPDIDRLGHPEVIRLQRGFGKNIKLSRHDQKGAGAIDDREEFLVRGPAHRRDSDIDITHALDLGSLHHKDLAVSKSHANGLFRV